MNRGVLWKEEEQGIDKFINQIIHGDCLEVMKEIPSRSIDMILCDLPYGTTACKWDIVIPFEPLWEQYERVIKDNGAIVLFGQEPFSSYLRVSNIENFKYDWYWEAEVERLRGELEQLLEIAFAHIPDVMLEYGYYVDANPKEDTEE